MSNMMSRIIIVNLLLISFSFFSSSAFANPPRSIIGGIIDDGHPAVGHIGNCTATLVGNQTVLTAAHCIDTEGERRKFIINNSSYEGTAYRHPHFIPYTNGFLNGSWRNDIAIIRLDEPVVGVDPMPICEATTTFPWATYITIVGFGRPSVDEDSYSWNKRVGTSPISRSDKLSIDSWGGSTICSGDSGGPALLAPTSSSQECVLGIAVGGSDSWTRSMHSRPDGHKSWIDDTATINDPSVAWVSPTYQQQVCNTDIERNTVCYIGTWECRMEPGESMADAVEKCFFYKPYTPNDDEVHGD